jgi:hypothetical protein
MKKNLTKIDKKPLKPTQLAMINALKGQLGNVSAATAEVGISRQVHYDWLETNEEYRNACKEASEDVVDMAINSLHRQILDKNTQATMFFLKNQAKHRGYGDKKEIEITGTIANSLTDDQITEIISRLTK